MIPMPDNIPTPMDNPIVRVSKDNVGPSKPMPSPIFDATSVRSLELRANLARVHALGMSMKRKKKGRASLSSLKAVSKRVITATEKPKLKMMVKMLAMASRYLLPRRLSLVNWR